MRPLFDYGSIGRNMQAKTEGVYRKYGSAMKNVVK